MHIEPYAELEGVTRVCQSANFDGPQIAVVGSLHGNEPCGLHAIEALRARAEAGQLGALKGTLWLVHGNPDASREGKRFSEGGSDLNRLFDYGWEARLRLDQWSKEHHRAVALRPLLERVDALLDLHSSTADTPPFAIVTDLPASCALAAKVGASFVVRGFDAPGLLGDRVMLAPLDARGVPSVVVECGQHQGPDVNAIAERTALHFLTACEALPPMQAPPAEPTWLRLHDAIKKPSREFRFTRPLAGFECLAAGESVGQDGLLEVRTGGDCYTVMPNDTVGAGEDMLYLAVPDPR